MLKAKLQNRIEELEKDYITARGKLADKISEYNQLLIKNAELNKENMRLGCLKKGYEKLVADNKLLCEKTDSLDADKKGLIKHIKRIRKENLELKQMFKMMKNNLDAQNATNDENNANYCELYEFSRYLQGKVDAYEKALNDDKKEKS